MFLMNNCYMLGLWGKIRRKK